MYVSWNWLSEFVNLDDLTPAEVGRRLTMAGLELEGIETVGNELGDIVVGHIIEREQHPDAEKLSLCKVDIGQDEPLQIVCGAPNARQGLRAPLIPVGGKLPDGTKIKKGKLRGVTSYGMLCSAKELELLGGHDGLLELSEDLAAGTPIPEALDLLDTVLEFSVTPNRSECLSIHGIAREVALLFDRPLLKSVARQTEAAPASGELEAMMNIVIDDPDACSRYACAAIKNIKVCESPEWLQKRLNAIGVRPVNNLVDVTNYLLFEAGQPLHAFDLGKLQGDTLSVRFANEGETIESIDHEARELLTSDLVIADASGPVAIAGVMGGVGTEISDETTSVLIECANFKPTLVRKTSRRLGMHSDSSHRFERGVDYAMVPAVLQRTIELMLATQPEGHEAQLVSGIIDELPQAVVATEIALPLNMSERILGMSISDEQVVQILRSLQLDVEVEDSTARVTVPAFRPDLTRPIDLVEEVARIIGFDALPTLLPPGTPGSYSEIRDDAPVEQKFQPIQTNQTLREIRNARAALAALGMNEALNWSFLSPSKLAAVSGDVEGLRLKNPLGEETSVMRTSLLPGLLGNIAGARARGAQSVALFEFGHLFPKEGGSAFGGTGEPRAIGGVFWGSAWNTWGAQKNWDAFDAKAAVLALGRALQRPLTVKAAQDTPHWANPAALASIFCGETFVGFLGEIHPNTLDTWEIEEPVFAFEVNLEAILSAGATDYTHVAPPRHQASERDTALLVDASTTYEQIEAALANFRVTFLESWELFDVFEGDKLPEGKKSIALRAVYRKADGSLTDKQIEKSQKRFVSRLVAELGAEQR